MAEFLRPEARATLWRWREVFLGVGIVLLGGWWLATFYPPVRWIGWCFVSLGVVFAIAGAQRARFRQPGQGPGAVRLVEGRLAYFGPLTGGTIDIADITRLELEPQALPAAHWVLTGVGGARLEVPVNAEGADALFDAFARLPDIDTEAMLTVLRHTPDARITVWERTRPLLH